MTSRSTRSPRRRTIVVLAIVLAVFVAFVVRLVDIQVVNAKENIQNSLSYGMGVTRTLAGTRGSIVDTDGKPLATSVVNYTCQFTPVNIGGGDTPAAQRKAAAAWQKASARIATITGLTTAKVRAIVSDALTADPHSQYALLARGLNTEQYRELMELGTDYLSCLPQPARTYPDGAVAGSLVGYVGSEGQPLAGLELSENSCLKPHSGSLTLEKGKDGVVIPGTEVEKPAVNGGTLTLTIDADLQWYMEQLAMQAQKATQAKFATVSVLQVKTGKLRAAAEYPTVDPNNINAPGSFLDGSHIFDWSFEPGSTFKSITASTLIDAYGLTPTSTDGPIPSLKRFPNGAVVRDAFPHPDYDYTLTGVLIDSSNVGASTFSQLAKPSVRYDYMKKFGIGSGSAIRFLGQMHGVVHPSQSWSNQMLYDTSYGQGVTTTIPELMGAYDAIANDGVKMPLQLVESCTKADGQVVRPKLPAPTRVIKTSTAKAMQKILENVALQSPDYANTVSIPGYNVAVKSGTGQIAKDGTYLSSVYYTTMIGFAPAEDPQYIVAVTLDEPLKGRSSAANAPYWREAMTQVLKTYRVMPSTTKPTVIPKFG